MSYVTYIYDAEPFSSTAEVAAHLHDAGRMYAESVGGDSFWLTPFYALSYEQRRLMEAIALSIQTDSPDDEVEELRDDVKAWKRKSRKSEQKCVVLERKIRELENAKAPPEPRVIASLKNTRDLCDREIKRLEEST